MTTINNDWYIYENDIYGVNALLEFGSKEELANYVLEEEFAEFRLPEGISEEGQQKLEQVTQQFKKGELTNKQYSTALEELLTEEEGEIENIHVDSFEQVCQGQSYLGEMAIEIFAERKDLGELKSIPEELKGEFKEFMDGAVGDWVG